MRESRAVSAERGIGRRFLSEKMVLLYHIFFAM